MFKVKDATTQDMFRVILGEIAFYAVIDTNALCDDERYVVFYAYASDDLSDWKGKRLKSFVCGMPFSEVKDEPAVRFVESGLKAFAAELPVDFPENTEPEHFRIDEAFEIPAAE